MNPRPTAISRSFYAARVSEFLEAGPHAILGRLTSRQGELSFSAEPTQVHAWERSLEILASSFRQIGPQCDHWSVLLEVSLHRLGKRLDAVVLSPGVVCVVELKVGAARYESGDRQQTEGYAHALRDFHEVSQSRLIVPILCAEKGPRRALHLNVTGQVADLIEANETTLAAALTAAANASGHRQDPLDWQAFEASSYRPTPTIIEAARDLYAGHRIADIGRGDAADEALQRTAAALREAVERADQRREKLVCFVTGAPGAGKTLLGLDLALAHRRNTAPTALLSGNRPLVHVLTEALATDTAKRTRIPKEKAKQQAEAAIQNLLGYLREHVGGAQPPPEHVIIFDEAQRAWNAEVGLKLLKRQQSEPLQFLSVLDRLDWACLVCLVGPGQEINRGEEGLALWGEALSQVAADGRPWRVLAAPQAARGGPDVSGAGLLEAHQEASFPLEEEPRFHLGNSIRAFRNELHGKWVSLLLNGQVDEARQLSQEMKAPPAYLTRDLLEAKAWLRQHRRGGRSAGLLTSSGAIRLVADGVPPAPRSNELSAIGHWFLQPFTDFRSAGALETPLSEFGCQGLEVDYAGICWGGDLLWHEEKWLVRKMQSPHWRRVKDEEAQRFRLNSYRVLLTRARAGTVIYVPRGDVDDPTRIPKELDTTAQALEHAGCQPLESARSSPG